MRLSPELVPVVSNSSLALFVLPVGIRDLFLAVSDRFKWGATFNHEIGSAEWDIFQARLADIESGLMDDVRLVDLVAVLERIAVAVESIPATDNQPIADAILDVVTQLGALVAGYPDVAAAVAVLREGLDG